MHSLCAALLSAGATTIPAVFLTAALLSGTQALAVQDEPQLESPSAGRFDGRSIAEWIEEWRLSPSRASRDRAKSALRKIGAPCVPALVAVLREDGAALEDTFRFLCEMGPDARWAVPALREIVSNKTLAAPAGWRSRSISAREFLIQTLSYAGWAFQDLVPVLAAVLEDEHETESIRRAAIKALGGMGDAALPTLQRLVENQRLPEERRVAGLLALANISEAGLPVLRPILENRDESERIRSAAIAALRGKGPAAAELLQSMTRAPEDSLRLAAHSRLALQMSKSRSKSQTEYYAEVVREHPLDRNVRDYLLRTRAMIGTVSEANTELAREILAMHRRELEERANPEIALRLARMIQDQLLSTHLLFKIGTGGASARLSSSARNDPRESHWTMKEVLERGFRQTRKGSEFHRVIGIGLAKLHLLMGDWKAMNLVLVEIGEKPMPESSRPFLAAPPVDWTNLQSNWLPCEESLRTGTGSFEACIEMDSQGLKGAHVLLKQVPPPRAIRGSATGLPVDTLAYAPQPFDGFPADASFGYAAQNVASTRYAVTGPSGVVKFEQLPGGWFVLEILIPTANFPAPGRSWKLWAKSPTGELVPPAGSLDPLGLEEGGHYVQPRLIVRRSD